MLVPLTSLASSIAPRLKRGRGPALAVPWEQDPERRRVYQREWYRRNVRPLKTKQRKLRA